MRNLKYWFSIFCIGLIISCTEIVELDLNNDTNHRLVVEGKVSSLSQIQHVRLSWSSNYFYNQQSPAVSGAMVSISDGSNTYLLKEKTAGMYQTDSGVVGVVGKVYKLNIRLSDGFVCEASDTLYPVSDIDSMKFSPKYYDRFSDDSIYNLYMYAQEPHGIGNFYLWEYSIDNQSYTDTLRQKSFTDDAQVDGSYIYDFDVFRIKDRHLKNDSALITFFHSSISRKYYDFVIALMLETDWRGSPFDGPPANVPGNISNGALGFFHATDVKKIENYLYRNPKQVFMKSE